MGSAALLCVLSLLEAVAGSALDNDSIRTAVEAWLSDSAAAEAAYGHISTWDTSGVTDMSWLFCADSRWTFCNTAGVTSMHGMFSDALSFNRDIGGWAVHNVKIM